jgi:hypothetical protein
LPITVKLPDESNLATLVLLYEKYKVVPEGVTAHPPAFAIEVELVAVVAVAALPVIDIPQVPLAPVPVGPGTSVPITKPKLVLAFAAVEAAVPPSAIAKSVIPVIRPRL